MSSEAFQVWLSQGWVPYWDPERIGGPAQATAGRLSPPISWSARRAWKKERQLLTCSVQVLFEEAGSPVASQAFLCCCGCEVQPILGWPLRLLLRRTADGALHRALVPLAVPCTSRPKATREERGVSKAARRLACALAATGGRDLDSRVFQVLGMSRGAGAGRCDPRLAPESGAPRVLCQLPWAQDGAAVA